MICLNQDPSRVRLSCWWFRLVHPLIDFPCFHPPRLPPALPGAQARPFPSSVSRLWLPASSRCHLIGSCIFVIAQRHSASGFVCRLGAHARACVCALPGCCWAPCASSHEETLEALLGRRLGSDSPYVWGEVT